MSRVIPPKDTLLERLREQYDAGEEIHPHLEALLKANPPKRKHESIQWVIDALGGKVIPAKAYDNHKTDSFRADENISWCPKCKYKWNMYEGAVWKSPDSKLWKEKICPDCDSHVK
jgi:hypothetical protein